METFYVAVFLGGREVVNDGVVNDGMVGVRVEIGSVGHNHSLVALVAGFHGVFLVAQIVAADHEEEVGMMMMEAV